MCDFMLTGEAFGVSLSGRIQYCHLFQDKRSLLIQRRHDVRPRVSINPV
jgi:hypothetical protein